MAPRRKPTANTRINTTTDTQSLKSDFKTFDNETHQSFPQKPQTAAASTNNNKLDLNNPEYKKFLDTYGDHSCKPVHQDSNIVEQVLKLFDFMSEYGPTGGISRLERWNRAEKLGKQPPQLIKQILLTKEGQNDPKYSQSYLYQHC